MKISINTSSAQSEFSKTRISAPIFNFIETCDAITEPCAIVDFNILHSKISLWKSYLPEVELLHHVKSNNNPDLLLALADLGIQFQLSTKKDIEALVAAGLSTEDSILANSCKVNSLIKAASKANVSCMSFDSENELVKIKKSYPSAELILQITTTKVEHEFASNHGAQSEHWRDLLQKAFHMNLKVIGVGFNLLENDFDALENAIEESRKIFSMASEIGFSFSTLHLGTFEDREPPFAEFATQLAYLLETQFPRGDYENFRVLANTTPFHLNDSIAIVTPVVSTNNSALLGFQINVDSRLNSFNATELPTLLITKGTSVPDEVEAQFIGLDEIGEKVIFPKARDGDLLLWNLTDVCCSSQFHLYFVK